MFGQDSYDERHSRKAERRKTKVKKDAGWDRWLEYDSSRSDVSIYITRLPSVFVGLRGTSSL
uniref:Uncharacterized protein n=1 Tax=Arion vulgaris TaxID=1028688 RepID=A0A0B6ZEE7_9EUPU